MSQLVWPFLLLNSCTVIDIGSVTLGAPEADHRWQQTKPSGHMWGTRFRYCIHYCFYKSTPNHSKCSPLQIQVIGLCYLTCISEQSKRAVECWVN